MTRVLRFFFTGLIRLGRQRFGSFFVGPEAGRFINGNRMNAGLFVILRRLQVNFADFLHLPGERFLIFLGGKTPTLGFVRLQVDASQDSSDVRRRNRGHDLALNRFIGDFPTGPFADGAIRSLARRLFMPFAGKEQRSLSLHRSICYLPLYS